VDFLTVAGHKFYTPKGVGALYIREGTALTPLLHGGGQEGGRRSGTENVPYIVGLGEACRLVRERLAADRAHFQALRDRLHSMLQEGYPRLVLNGHQSERLPNTLNVSFPGLSGRAILSGIWDLEASVGAACHGDEEHPSPVLTAMGTPPDAALGAVRLSVGRTSTLRKWTKPPGSSWPGCGNWPAAAPEPAAVQDSPPKTRKGHLSQGNLKPMLAVDSLEVSYGAVRVLRGISLAVPEGRIVALLGANGAGKTTTLRAICGLAPAASGRILWEGEDLVGLPAHAVIRRGLALCPEGRRLFPNLTVLENLLLGGYNRNKTARAQTLAWVLDAFPPAAGAAAPAGRHFKRRRAADGGPGPDPHEPPPPGAPG
jgi:hypothetical protein